VKKSEARQIIFEHLGGVLTPAGFRLRKREEAFARRIEGGVQVVGIPLIDYNPVFVFSLVIVIRLDVVEQIFHRFVNIDPKYYSQGTTTITQLEYFIKEIPPEYCRDGAVDYKVRTPEDIAGAMAHLLPVVRGSILPFFERYQTVSAVHAGVNCSVPSIDSTQPPWGAMDALILARLADSSDFERLVGLYYKHLHDRLRPENRDRFDSLIAYLRRHSPTALAQAGSGEGVSAI
jgi:hypothetical protein